MALSNAERNARWVKRHPDRYKDKYIRFNRSPRGRFAKFKLVARRRRITVSCTFEEWFTLLKPTGYFEDHLHNRPEKLTIDRIDNLQGYFIGNMQVITMSENSKKDYGKRVSAPR